MPKEIEKKYLVNDNSFESLACEKHHITQSYLVAEDDIVVRIRMIDDKAFLTIKGKNNGPVRYEWERKISKSDAVEMLKSLPIVGTIEKTRYKVDAGRGLSWEIDRFHGRNEGLILAEIELTDESVDVILPNFIGKEVTSDPRYYNSNLAKLQ